MVYKKYGLRDAQERLIPDGLMGLRVNDKMVSVAIELELTLKNRMKLIGSKINGIIICDHRGNKDDILLRDLHQKLLSGGKFNQSKYDNLIEGVFLAPSHLSVGIQLADMVAGGIYRKYYANDERFFNQIKSSIREHNNKFEGYGIVKWPKK